jgi:hypothetical protein
MKKGSADPPEDLTAWRRIFIGVVCGWGSFLPQPVILPLGAARFWLAYEGF